MTINSISIRLWITVLILIFSFLAVSCGGVAKNPAEPPWKKQDQGAPGGTTGSKGEEGAPPIREGASYEELLATGKQSLEGGFIRNAAEAYAKALEADNKKPDAALAYAITKIAGSVQEFSILTQPGIDLLYYNTPLIGRWELFPTPMTEEDSYLLRIAALGTKYSSPYNPKGAGTPKPPAAAPKAPGGSTTTPTPPSGEKEKIETTNPEERPMIPSGETGERSTMSYGGGRSGSQALGPSGEFEQGADPGTQKPGGTMPGSGKDTFQYGGGKQLQNLQFDKDIFPDLIKEYKDISRTYNSGFLNFEAVNKYADDLKKIVDDIILKLEAAKGNVDKDKFALELPFLLDKEKKGVYQIYFRSYDYSIILGYMKLIQGQLAYRKVYQSNANNLLLFLSPEDKDNDDNLTPSEYYPPEPFGTVKDDTAKDALEASSTLMASGVDILVKSLGDFYNDNKLMEYAGNRIIPANINQALLDKIQDESYKYSDFQVLMTAGKGDRTFFTTTEAAKVEVNIANIFGENAPKSVSSLLPTFNSNTLEPVVQADGNIFPDPTWGGIFTEPFNSFDPFRVHSDISGLLMYQGDPIKEVQITINGKDPIKSDDKGKFQIKDVSFNELVGIQAEVVMQQIPKPIKAQLRSPWIMFDLMTVDQSMMPPVGGETQSGGATSMSGDTGTTETTPSTGTGTGSRIEKIKEDREKEKKDEEGEGEKQDDSGEQGEGGETPSEEPAGVG